MEKTFGFVCVALLDEEKAEEDQFVIVIIRFIFLISAFLDLDSEEIYSL